MQQAKSVLGSRNTVLPYLQPWHHKLTALEQVEMLVLVLPHFESECADHSHWVARQVPQVEDLVRDKLLVADSCQPQLRCHLGYLARVLLEQRHHIGHGFGGSIQA